MLTTLLKYIRNLLRPEIKPTTPPAPKLISLDDYFTSSGKFPARGMSSEITPEIRANAEELLRRVNLLLLEIGHFPVSINSGFRTKLANQETGGSLTSGHLTGKAIDIEDKHGMLDGAISMTVPELLVKYDLYLEDPARTLGWTHLDTKPREKRIFKI